MKFYRKNENVKLAVSRDAKRVEIAICKPFNGRLGPFSVRKLSRSKFPEVPLMT